MKKNIGLMASSTYIRIGSQFVVFLVLARTLGPVRFGLISYWMSVAMLSTLPLNYGFGVQLLRDIGCAPERSVVVVAEMLAAKTLIMVITSLLAVCFSWQFADRTDLFLLFIVMAIAESFIDFFNYVLRTQNRYGAEARLAFISSIFQFLMLLLIALAFRDVIWVAGGYAVSRIVTLILTLRVLHHCIPLSEIVSRLTFKSIPRTLFSGFPYAADMGLSSLNSVLDNVILKHMVNISSVGVYQAGSRLTLGGATFATVISNVYLPKISSIDPNSHEFEKAIDRMGLFFVCSGGILGLIFTFGNTFLVNIFFGSNYIQLEELLPWFGLVLMLRYIAASCGMNLTASGYQLVRVMANSAYLLCFLVSSVILISHFGTVGILMASAFATLVLIGAYLFYLFINKRPCGITLSSFVMILFFVASIVVNCVER